MNFKKTSIGALLLFVTMLLGAQTGLAGKFRDGKVRLIDNVPLMDRAVSGLIGRLQSSSTS